MGLARRPLLLVMLMALIGVAVIACKGDPGAGKGGPSAQGKGENDFTLSTPVYPQEIIQFTVGAADGTFETDFTNAISAAFGVVLPGEVAVVPEPGANGVTVAESFEDKPTVGHWMLVINSDQIAAIATGVTEIDVTRKYLPTATGTLEPFVFVAATGSAFSNWDDVVAAGSSGSVTVGVKGPDTGAAALNAAGIADAFELTLVTIPAGDPEARIATADGLGLLPLGEAVALVKSGAGTAMLVLGPSEVASLAGVPTTASAGSSFEGVPYLRGIAISRQTPQFLKDRINAALRNGKASAPYQTFITDSGLAGIDIPAGDAGLTFRSQIAEFQALAGQ